MAFDIRIRKAWLEIAARQLDLSAYSAQYRAAAMQLANTSKELSSCNSVGGGDSAVTLRSISVRQCTNRCSVCWRDKTVVSAVRAGMFMDPQAGLPKLGTP